MSIPGHLTECKELNTNNSLLCTVKAGELKGQIYWAAADGSRLVSHLSQFGTARIGNGAGTLDANHDLSLKIAFSDEPDGTYRQYEYAWVSDDEYRLMSRQYAADGEPTGNWYGGTFVRLSE